MSRFINTTMIKGGVFLLLFFVLYIALFLTVQENAPFTPEAPPYVTDREYYGFLLDPLEDCQQKKDASCGHSALAYLLNYYAITSTEEDIASVCGVNEWLSFYDMATYIDSINYNYQALEVDSNFFKDKSYPCVFHAKWGHFITFLKFDNRNDCLIFDPSRGLVLISWETLIDIWDGYVFYVYS